MLPHITYSLIILIFYFPYELFASDIIGIRMKVTEEEKKGKIYAVYYSYKEPVAGAWRGKTAQQILKDPRTNYEESEMRNTSWEQEIEDGTLGHPETHPTKRKTVYVETTSVEARAKTLARSGSPPKDDKSVGGKLLSRGLTVVKKAKTATSAVSDAVKGAAQNTVTQFNGQCHMEAVHDREARRAQGEQSSTSDALKDIFCEVRELNTRLKTVTDPTLLAKKLSDLNPAAKAKMENLENEWRSVVGSMSNDEKDSMGTYDVNNKESAFGTVGLLLGLLMKPKSNPTAAEKAAEQTAKTGIAARIIQMPIDAGVGLTLGRVRDGLHILELLMFGFIVLHDNGKLNLDREIPKMNAFIRIIRKIVETVNTGISKIPGMRDPVEIPDVDLTEGFAHIAKAALKSRIPSFVTAGIRLIGINKSDVMGMMKILKI